MNVYLVSSSKAYHNRDTTWQSSGEYHNRGTASQSSRAYHNRDTTWQSSRAYHNRGTTSQNSREYHKSDRLWQREELRLTRKTNLCCSWCTQGEIWIFCYDIFLFTMTCSLTDNSYATVPMRHKAGTHKGGVLLCLETQKTVVVKYSMVVEHILKIFYAELLNRLTLNVNSYNCAID